MERFGDINSKVTLDIEGHVTWSCEHLFHTYNLATKNINIKFKSPSTKADQIFVQENVKYRRPPKEERRLHHNFNEILVASFHFMKNGGRKKGLRYPC